MQENILIDAHIHLALDGIDFKQARLKHKDTPDLNILRAVLRKYKSLGIRFLRDGGDNLNVSLYARELAMEEGMILRTPVYALYKKGRYGSFLGRPIADMAEFKDEFARLLSFKPDHLKIPFTGIMDFSQFGKVDAINFTFDELYYMIQSAKDKNLNVMVHAYTAVAVRMAILAGADTIEHGYFLTDDELYLMLENDTVWVPTLAPLGNLVKQNDLRFKNEIQIIEQIYAAHTQKVAKAFELGVRVAAGSDAGSHAVCHGKGFFDELDHLASTGIKKETILSAARVNGMKALNLEQHDIAIVFNNTDEVGGAS
ncbi:amidohydrolase family protein [Dehalobacter sp. DCM]|uniref:amidohydrolase family protein n=1 Tax=Dehalobacter sp. DCM TaxID=2907827 RepID=UPI00308172C6|nr:amidohydrolase family protein [Dehalobacter sp. DCM]